MKTLTSAQMRELDRRCIEDIGIPGVILMHAAGKAVFEQIDSGPVGIVCGGGNNGGDGFVAAMLSLLAGYKHEVILLADRASVKGDAAAFMRIFENIGGTFTVCTDESVAREKVAALAHCRTVVDAMLGTGAHGEPRGAIRAAIEAWPPVRTIAVDVPSGVNADTGDVASAAIRANVTVTFQFAKTGFRVPEAQAHLGYLVVADIGIPAICAQGLD